MPRSVGSVWNLREANGQLKSRAIACAVDVRQPQGGLTHVEIGGASLTGRLLRVRRDESDSTYANVDLDARAWPLVVSDAYVRGDDLVASYSESEQWPYAPQIYWRAGTLNSVDGVLDSLTLLVSVQTHLLDTFPQINVNSQIGANEIMRVIPTGDDGARAESLTSSSLSSFLPEAHPCCLLWRLKDERTSYAEIMLENDFRALEVESSDRQSVSSTWRVFADFLEKGVIRRARLQSVFLPREDDIELAAACCRVLAQRPLPLTT